MRLHEENGTTRSYYIDTPLFPETGILITIKETRYIVDVHIPESPATSLQYIPASGILESQFFNLDMRTYGSRIRIDYIIEELQEMLDMEYEHMLKQAN